jgi:hypothetical protein
MCDNAISRFVTLDPTARWVREGHDALFYKGGGKDKNDCDSYRPVTCLLHFYKWFAVPASGLMAPLCLYRRCYECHAMRYTSALLSSTCDILVSIDHRPIGVDMDQAHLCGGMSM